MHADIEGALSRINKCWYLFTHKGQIMHKEQIKKVLRYGINKGYKSTSEFTDSEIDDVLSDDWGQVIVMK